MKTTLCFSQVIVTVIVFVIAQVLFVANEVHEYLFYYYNEDDAGTTTTNNKHLQLETSRNIISISSYNDYNDSSTFGSEQHRLSSLVASTSEGITNSISLLDDATKVVDQQQPPLLPTWITSYTTWHNEMRQKYPGPTIFTTTDPNAPNIIIRYCGSNCGGLHDRLGQFPMDLYIANQTQRVFFYWWDDRSSTTTSTSSTSLSLEEFLIPNTLFNWTIPIEIQQTLNILDHNRLLKHKMHDAHFSISNWSNIIDDAIVRARDGRYRHHKILYHSIQAHRMEHILESKLRELGEIDTICSTTTFGTLFRNLFRPIPEIEKQISTIYQYLGLVEKEYTAVHLRVRHPSGVPEHERDGILISKEIEGGDVGIHSADRQGLRWAGKSKDYAVQLATRALQCSQVVQKFPNEPVYLFSDSNDLVHYFAEELPQQMMKHRERGGLIQGGEQQQQSKEDVIRDLRAWTATKDVAVVSRRNVSMEENYHIDLQRGHPPQSYYATFVDLLLASRARCVLYGCGRYGKFAAKLSGSSCELWYQDNIVENEASTGGHDPKYKCPLINT